MILIGLAVLPALILMGYIYKKDKLEPESPRILGKCIFGGLLAAAASMLLETVVAGPITSIFGDSSLIYYIVENFIGVALIEEGTKLFFCRMFTWKDHEFNYRFDGVVYMVFTSLGFAAIENVLYLFMYGPGVLLTRALLSIPAHAAFAVFLGSYYGTAKIYSAYGDEARAKAIILKGLLIATLLHGFFDFCLTIESDTATIVFFVFVIIMDIVVIRRVRNDSNTDRLITYQETLN